MKHSTSESYSITRCASKTVKPILTNEEWLQTATTEQLIEFLEKITDPHVGYLVGYWEMWLKQPHTKE